MSIIPLLANSSFDPEAVEVLSVRLQCGVGEAQAVGQHLHAARRTNLGAREVWP